MGSLVAWLRRSGFRRGVLGDSRVWMGIWSVLTVGRLVRRVTRSKPVVEQFTLKPGQTIVISDLGVPADR
jgi:hypothetical protein